MIGFELALAALKRGSRITRTGWNGKGMFAYMVPAASYPVQTGAAKEHFGEDRWSLIVLILLSKQLMKMLRFGYPVHLTSWRKIG